MIFIFKVSSNIICTKFEVMNVIVCIVLLVLEYGVGVLWFEGEDV